MQINEGMKFALKLYVNMTQTISPNELVVETWSDVTP